MHRRFSKFTLWQLMALVSLLCVALAFLRHALRYWGPSDVTTIAVTILFVTNILAWFQGARWQVFWVGFGIFGWAYLTISLESPAGEYLPTTWLLDGLHDRLYSIPAVPTFGADFDEVAAGPVHGYHFRRAGQSVISLIIALLGGVGASLLFSGKSKDSGEP